MPNRDIIVMGASAGGFTAFNRILKQLPKDLKAAIFVVGHTSSYARSVVA